jgi:hypothetical protein
VLCTAHTVLAYTTHRGARISIECPVLTPQCTYTDGAALVSACVLQVLCCLLCCVWPARIAPALPARRRLCDLAGHTPRGPHSAAPHLARCSPALSSLTSSLTALHTVLFVPLPSDGAVDGAARWCAAGHPLPRRRFNGHPHQRPHRGATAAPRTRFRARPHDGERGAGARRVPRRHARQQPHRHCTACREPERRRWRRHTSVEAHR